MNEFDQNLSLTANELRKAIEALKIALQLLKTSHIESPENIELHKALRDACIQRFEFCVEHSWKTSMRILGLDVKAPNTAIREMARNNLISDTTSWFDFLVARDKTSHTYDEDIAKEVYSWINVALPFFEDLYIKLVETLK